LTAPTVETEAAMDKLSDWCYKEGENIVEANYSMQACDQIEELIIAD
jgi:hypothetical protein